MHEITSTWFLKHGYASNTFSCRSSGAMLSIRLRRASNSLFRYMLITVADCLVFCISLTKALQCHAIIGSQCIGVGDSTVKNTSNVTNHQLLTCCYQYCHGNVSHTEMFQRKETFHFTCSYTPKFKLHTVYIVSFSLCQYSIYILHLFLLTLSLP